jgi:hypothetical protein
MTKPAVSIEVDGSVHTVTCENLEGKEIAKTVKLYGSPYQIGHILSPGVHKYRGDLGVDAMARKLFGEFYAEYCRVYSAPEPPPPVVVEERIPLLDIVWSGNPTMPKKAIAHNQRGREFLEAWVRRTNHFYIARPTDTDKYYGMSIVASDQLSNDLQRCIMQIEHNEKYSTATSVYLSHNATYKL